jgi:hypothetical protein
MCRATRCVWWPFSEGGPQYSKAVALIRGEHPGSDAAGLYSREELAQAGLANDSPYARPSILMMTRNSDC